MQANISNQDLTLEPLQTPYVHISIEPTTPPLEYYSRFFDLKAIEDRLDSHSLLYLCLQWALLASSLINLVSRGIDVSQKDLYVPGTILLIGTDVLFVLGTIFSIIAKLSKSPKSQEKALYAWICGLLLSIGYIIFEVLALVLAENGDEDGQGPLSFLEDPKRKFAALLVNWTFYISAGVSIGLIYKGIKVKGLIEEWSNMYDGMEKMKVYGDMPEQLEIECAKV